MDRFGLSAQFDFNSGDSANQISGVSKAITSLIDTIQDLEKAVGDSDNFGKKIAKQLDFAPKKATMRGVTKDVTAIGKAATDTKKALSPLKDEFRALRAESRNIDMGDMMDVKQYKQGRSELEKYTKSLKNLQTQVHGNSTAEREFSASLVAGQAAAKNKLSIMESQRQALRAAGKVAVSQAAVGIGRATIDPVKQFATDSMKILSEFDDKMAAVAAVVGPTAEQLKGLRKQAAALGASTRYDASQAAEAMGELGSAGFTAQQITIGLSDTLSLASAGALGLAEAAEISASSLNGFGLDVNQLGHVVDVFAIAAAKTNAGIQDIGETMKYAAPAAALFGATIEETTALIGTMANAGIKGSSSGTALRSLFTKLASPTGPALAALDGMGIKVKDATGKLRNVMEIMDDLQAKMGLNSADLLKQKNFFARIAATGENVDEAIAKLKTSGDKQADNIETIKTIIGVEAMGGFSTALQNQAKTKQAVYAEMSASFDEDGFKTLLMETTKDNKNFDKLRELAADKTSVGQEKFKKLDISKYISESTKSYTEATQVINKATSTLAMQGASSVKGDDLALVQKNLTLFKDTDEEFANQFKDIDFSSFAQGTDLLAALNTGTGSAAKGMFQFQAAVKAAGLSVPAFVGAGKNMANVMENSLAGDIRNLQSALDSLRLNAIEPFEPIIRGVINTISGFANTLANLPTPIVALIGGLQILALAMGAVLLAGGSIGVILFGFEQAAATAAIATTVLESSTIALTGFFGTSVAAAGALNPLNLELIALKSTAGQLFAPLGALKTLMFELGRAMLAQMMSPLGLTLIGLSALYLIFEALTPQFDVLGRLMGGLVAPFGFIYGFAVGIGKALMTLVAPLVKISTTAAGFPFESVAKSLSLAVDYFGKFATNGEAAGRAFVDYFAAPIQIAASLIATAWDGAIGRIQGGMDGLVKYAIDIAQMLINTLNHSPTEKIPDSWDGATERITAGLLGLIHIAQYVAGGMVKAFDWAVAGIANIPGIGGLVSTWLTNTASQFQGYLDNQLDFDVAGALISKMEEGTAELSDYFEYFGKTLLPGLANTWMTGPLSQYFNKFAGNAATLTGLKFDDIISVEEFDLGATLKIFDRIDANAKELASTFMSTGAVITAVWTTFTDPLNTASAFSKITDLITSDWEAIKTAATAAGKGIALVLGSTVLVLLPTIGAVIGAIATSIQFVFKTIGLAIFGVFSVFEMFANSLEGVTEGMSGLSGSTFDLKGFFLGQAGAIDKTTTALGANLNVLSLLALVGSTLPLGFIFSKGAITEELFKEIPAFYKAIALLLPAGMGTVIANGLTDEMIKGLGAALTALGSGLLNTLGITLDWYGLMKRKDFDAAVAGMGKQFAAAQVKVTDFVMGIYNLPSVKPIADSIGGFFTTLAADLGFSFNYINMGIRTTYDLLKQGFDIGEVHISIVDILGLDIAIKAAQGFFKLLTLDSFINGLKAAGTSLQGIGGMLSSVTDLFKTFGTVFNQFYAEAIPPLLAFYETVKTKSGEVYKILETGVIETTKFVLKHLRAINPEIYDFIAGNAKKASEKVVAVAKAGATSAVAIGKEAEEFAVAVGKEIDAAEKIGKVAKFLKILVGTPFEGLIGPIKYVAELIESIVSALYKFPFENLKGSVNFLKNLPYGELILFAKMFGKSLYEALEIVRFIIDGFKRVGVDAGKLIYLFNNFFDIYKKTEGFSKFGAGGKFGIKILTPLDMILASSKGVNSQLSKIALMKFFKVSGSLGMITEESLTLGRILSNFGTAQKLALLPGVIAYLAAWVGAAPIIYAILKGIAKASLMALGSFIGNIINEFFSADWKEIGVSVATATTSASVGLVKGILNGIVWYTTSIFQNLAIAAIGILGPVGQVLIDKWMNMDVFQKRIAILAASLAAAIVAAFIFAVATGGGLGPAISGIIATATSQGAKKALIGLAVAIMGLMLWNRDKIIGSVGNFLSKIPGYFFAIVEAIKSTFAEIAANILAILGTMAILGIFMGKQIKSMIATALSPFTDAISKLKPKNNFVGAAYENVRRNNSDRQVDKDSVKIDTDAWRLKISSDPASRATLAALNKTGQIKGVTPIPEHEMASFTASMPRKQELNLLDREVNKLAEKRLGRDKKVKGEDTNLFGMRKFSTAQIEAESAKIYQDDSYIKLAAFRVSNSREAKVQTDKNINQAAIEQLNNNPASARNKKGNLDKDQISQQEAKIRADNNQMAKLTVGNTFTKLAEDPSLAASEALKGLGSGAERQKFINSGELIDEDLTIKAKNVELFVNSLKLPDNTYEDFYKKQDMTAAALAVFNDEVRSGKKPKDVQIQAEAVEKMYRSFSRLPLRPDRVAKDGDGNEIPNYLRFGSGNNIKGNIAAGAYDLLNDNQDVDSKALQSEQASYLLGSRNANTTFGQTVNQNIARAGVEVGDKKETNKQEAILVLQLNELGKIATRLGDDYTDTGFSAEIERLVSTAMTVADGDGTLAAYLAEAQLTKGVAFEAMIDGGSIKNKTAEIMGQVYGESNTAAINARRLETGAFGSEQNGRDDRIAELELLKQAMVDIIGEIHTIANPDAPGRQMQGKELAMMTQLFSGFAMGKEQDPDSARTKQLEALLPASAFKDYAMKTGEVKSGDVKYPFIDKAFDAKAEEFPQSMAKDLQFFAATNERFADTLLELDEAYIRLKNANGEFTMMEITSLDAKLMPLIPGGRKMVENNKVNPLEILDKITSPDIVSDANFAALIADKPTTKLDPEVDELLRGVLTKLSKSDLSTTLAMKDKQDWVNPKAKRAVAAARLVGIDVDTEIGRGVDPSQLATMANAAREELGFAMKSFMALAIPDAAQVKTVMKEFYKKMGVGNNIDWNEVLPMPEGSPVVTNADRYKAISSSFIQSPEQVADSQLAAKFMTKFDTELEKARGNVNGSDDPEAFLKVLASEGLFGGNAYDEKKFNQVAASLGLTEAIENNAAVISATNAVTTATDPTSTVTATQTLNNKKQAVLGQVYLTQQLQKINKDFKAPSVGSNNLKDDFKNLTGKFNSVESQGSLSNFIATLTARRSQKNSIEAVLTDLLPSSGNLKVDTEKIRTSAQLIASGQLDLLAPDLLLAVAAQTKKSVATLIRPDPNPKQTDRVQMNILRRMEIQRRLKDKGMQSDALDTMIATASPDGQVQMGNANSNKLYSGDFNDLYRDQQSKGGDNFTNTANALNLNGKNGAEAIVELMASLSNQSLMAKYEAKLALGAKSRDRDNKRSNQLAILAAEADLVAKAKEEDLAFKKLQGTRRYNNLMRLLIAKDPDLFKSMSAIGMPTAEAPKDSTNVIGDPSLIKQIADYNLVKILNDASGGQSEKPIEKFVRELVNRKEGGDETAPMAAFTSTLTKLAKSLGLKKTSELASLDTFDIGTVIPSSELVEVEKIFKQMEDNILKAKTTGNLNPELSNSNRSVVTRNKLEALLSKIYPTSPIVNTDKDPEALRSSKLNQLFDKANLERNQNEVGKDAMSGNFYERVLKGSRVPLQSTIESLQTARTAIDDGLSQDDIVKPEVVKFMAELDEVQKQLQLAVESNTSPVMAISKLMRLRNRAKNAELGTGLDTIDAIATNENTGSAVLSDKKLFGTAIDPKQISPEIFGSIRTGSEAEKRLQEQIGGGEISFKSSADYKLAELDAKLRDLTDRYQINNSSLVVLQDQFAEGSMDAYRSITNPRLPTDKLVFEKAGDGKLITALKKFYESAGDKGINLALPGAVLNTLAKFKDNPEGLELSKEQVQLLTEFADTSKSSTLTLDPMIRVAKEQLAKGIVPEQLVLKSLASALGAINGLSLAPKQVNGAPEQQLTVEEIMKATEMASNLSQSLKDTGSFNDIDRSRDLMDRIMANGKADATKLGAAVAAEYSTLYAYVDKDTNKIDTNLLVKGFEGVEFKAVTGNDQKQIIADIVEGRRKTIDKFTDNEQMFIDEFVDNLGISREQLFNLDKLIPKNTLGRITQIPGNIGGWFEREVRKIEKQKDFSLNKFMSRAGIDYEELTEVLRSEGFDAEQIVKLYEGSGASRIERTKNQGKSQSNLASLLKKYGGMTKRQANDAIVKNLTNNSNLDRDSAGERLREFVETKIQEQGYADRVLAKILSTVRGSSSEIGGADFEDRYESVADRGFTLVEQIGATDDQIKLLANLMGVNKEKLNKFFTDQENFSGGWIKAVIKAIDPLNINLQLAKILVGTKMGDGFAAKADKIAAKREAKFEAAGFSLKAMLVDPVIGSILRQFKSPAEKVLDGVIKITASSSDLINNLFGGRVFGAGMVSKALGGIEKDFREYKRQASKIDDMPGIGKNLKKFFAPLKGITSFFRRNQVAQAGTPDPQLPIDSTQDSDSQSAVAPKVSKLKQAFTKEGAKANIAGIVNFVDNSFINQGIRMIATSIGEAMQLAATEALDLAEGQQIVSERDLNGIRTTVNEQRAPLQTLKKKVGGMLVRFANPMQSIVELIGNAAIQAGQDGLDMIEQAEGIFEQIRSVDLPGKIEGMAGGIKDKLVAPFQGLVLPPALESLKQKIHSNITSMFETIGNAFGQINNTAVTTLGNVLSSVLGGIKNAFRGLRNFGSGLIDKFRPSPKQQHVPVWDDQAPTRSAAIDFTRAGTSEQFTPIDSPWSGGGSNPVPPVATTNPVNQSQPSNIAQIAAENAARRTADRLALQGMATDLSGIPVIPDAQTSNPSDSDPWADAIAESGLPRYTNAPEIIPTTNPVTPPANLPTQSIGINSPTTNAQSIVPTSVQPTQAERIYLPPGMTAGVVPETAGQLPTDDPNRPRGGAIVPYQPPMTRLPTANPVAPIPQAGMIRQLPTAEEAAKQAVKTKWDVLDEEVNQKIEENWNGTSDSIIKNIKNVALVSKKLGYWIMRNLSEGSPGPTFYMRQHYAYTADFIESEFKRLVTVAQRSGRAIHSSLTGAGDINPIDFSDLAREITAPSSPLPSPMAETTPDDAFTAALSQTDQFTAANQAAAQLAHNATVTHDQTVGTAEAMVAVAKGESRVALVGKKIFKLFTLMGKVMKFVPKGFVRIGAVFKKIGKPVMMMGAGLGAAGFAIQNIASNLSTLGLVNEEQTEMISKGSAMMEIFGGIGAIGGAAMQILTGGLAATLEAGLSLYALVLSPMTYAFLGIGAAAIASIFALNWLSKTFLGFDFIASIFGGIEGSMSSLSSFISEKLAPIIDDLRFQFASAFGYDALAAIDGAISWLSKAWNAGMVAIGIGLGWLQGVMSQAAEHISGVIGILKIAAAPLIAIGFLTFKLFEALFNAIAPRITELMPLLDQLALKFQAAFGPTIDWIVAAWANGIGSIGGMLVGLWEKAEDVGNWLIGALNCNPTVAIPLAWQGAVDSITAMMNFLPDRAKSVADRMVGFFANAFSFMGQKTPDLNAKANLTTTEETIKTAAGATGVTKPDNSPAAENTPKPSWIESAMSFFRPQVAPEIVPEPTTAIPGVIAPVMGPEMPPAMIQSSLPASIESGISPVASAVAAASIPSIVESTANPVASAIAAASTPAITELPELPALPELPDWAKGIQSFATDKMAEFNTAKPKLPLPIDPTGSLKDPKDVAQMLTARSEEIKNRAPMLLQGGAERKAERMDETATQIKDLVKQSEYLKSEYADLTNPQGFKKLLAVFGEWSGSTEKRTKEIIIQRGEIEKTLAVIVKSAKVEIAAPIGGSLLARLGIDPDAIGTAASELQAGVMTLGAQLTTGIENAVAPVADYWDAAMTSIAEVGVGGTAEVIFGGALNRISSGVGTVGQAFSELGGEVFESLKTMDFKRLQHAGTMFTSTLGEGLAQIGRGFSDAAAGAAFFAGFAVTSGLLPAIVLGGLALLLIFLTLKFGNLREIAVGAFNVMVGAAKVFWVVLSSIKPIVEGLGDVFKGIFAAMKGDFNPLKEAIANLNLEFEIMFARMAPGFAQITDGLKLITKGFQPVIDEGIIPIVEGIKAAFGRVVDFILDPFRNAIAGVKQFGADLLGIATKIVTDIQSEFSGLFGTIGASIEFALNSVKGFFTDLGTGIGNIVGIVTTTIEEIRQVFTTGITNITGAFKAAWDGINIGATGIEGIGKGIAGVAGEVVTLGGNILSSLGGATEGIRGEIGKLGSSFIDTNQDLLGAFQTSFDRIGQLFPNLCQIFTDGVNDFTAYFAVKFQGTIEFVQNIFNAIAKISEVTWDIAGTAFGKFDELLAKGIEGLSNFITDRFGNIGEVIGSIVGVGKQSFDDLLAAAKPMTDGLVAIFTGTVQDLDNLIQSGLDGFNGMVDSVATGFTTAFTTITTGGADLSISLAAIPAQVGMAFENLTGAIGQLFAGEFTSIKTSGAELLTALSETFRGGTDQIGLMISGITASFDGVSQSITSTIEALKATFSGLGEAIDGAMGNAFGGVKDKWQKTTGFMGKMMGRVAIESEETGQTILHNIAENSPGPTQRIRELYALTATSASNSLESIATAAGPIGDAIVDGLNPGELGHINPVAGIDPMTTSAPTMGRKAALQSLGGNVKKNTDFAGDILELSGNEGAAKGFKAISTGIDHVTTALDGVQIAKEIGEDFKILSGVMQGFSAVDAASSIGNMASGLMESGKVVWDAIVGFGQWIVAKIFQTEVAVASEATTTAAVVASSSTQSAAMLELAATTGITGSAFGGMGVAAEFALGMISAPLIPIIVGIAALIGIVYLLKTAFDNNFLGFGDLIYGIGNAIGFVWNVITGFFGALLGGAAAIGGEVFGSIGTAFTEIGQTIGMVFKLLSAPFVELFGSIVGIFAPIQQALGGTTSGLSIMQGIVNIILFPLKIVGEILKFVIWCLGKVIQLFVIVAGLVLGVILAPFMAIAKILTFVFDIVGTIVGAFVNIGSAIVSFFLNPFQAIVSIVQWIIDAVGGLVGSIGGGLLSAIQAVMAPFSWLGGLFGGNKPTDAPDVQKFATGGYVSGAGGPTDDKIPAMLSNGEFVVGAEGTRKNLSFLQAINNGVPVEEALQLMDVPHPIGDLPDRSVAGSDSAANSTVAVNNNYSITVNFGDIVLDGVTGKEAAEDFSRFLQSAEFQMAIQAALVQQVEAMR